MSLFFAAEYSCEYGSLKFYALCGVGGVLSCGLTHTGVVPLDLVKCRMQVCINFNISSTSVFYVASILRVGSRDAIFCG